MDYTIFLNVTQALKRLELFSALLPPQCIKESFYIPENSLNFLISKVFRIKISMKLVYQYMAIFCYFLITSNHLHPLQVENCDSNSRLVVDEDKNGKFRPERVKAFSYSNQTFAGQQQIICISECKYKMSPDSNR